MRYHHFLTAVALFIGTSLVGCSQPGETTDTTQLPETVDVTVVSFANSKCPIMGGKPTAELVAEYNGETIGFCCEGCPEKWAALSAEEQAEKFAKVHDHQHDTPSED